MISKRYAELLTALKVKIRHGRSVAVFTVNSQMLTIYWEIGNAIDDLVKAGGWGAKTVDHVAADLKTEFPEMRGISPRSLRYMREFAKGYPDFLKLRQPAAKSLGDFGNKKPKGKSSILRQPAAKLRVDGQHPAALIPWAHHQVILDKVKTWKERLFYLQKTVEQGWSRNVLSLQIDSHLFERQGKSITNFKNTLPDSHSDLAQETFKNPYLLDFLDLGEGIKEKDLESSLIRHMLKFVLELGRGFAFIGNQYKINVEHDEYFLDLLFFNYKLNCFIIFDLKIGDFKPEFAGKLNFYINAVDSQIREKQHNRTIGILLCKTPNETVVRYALEGVEKPMAVSDFKLIKVLPKEYKGEIPAARELEQEMERESKKLLTPIKKEFEVSVKKIAAGTKDSGRTHHGKD